MREYPILFQADMMRAILASDKNQTRRTRNLDEINEAPDEWRFIESGWADDRFFVVFAKKGKSGVRTIFSPYGGIGDRLWVRETFSGPHALKEIKPKDWQGCWQNEPVPLWFWADGAPEYGDWTKPKKPAIHMPRWASRLDLEVTGLRVERLHNIREIDAIGEGVVQFQRGITRHDSENRDLFGKLWQEINGVESWNANPWVWVINFPPVNANG